jgi:hypothetical protein
MIDVRCLNLNERLSCSYGFDPINKINIKYDEHNQALKDVD